MKSYRVVGLDHDRLAVSHLSTSRYSWMSMKSACLGGGFAAASQGRHERREAKAFVLVGDCNVREGEDQCLRREGWRDAWEEKGASAEGEHWTWKAGRNQARFDRVYMHDGGGHAVISAKMKTMPGVWGWLSDHVPLHVRGAPSGGNGYEFWM